MQMLDRVKRVLLGVIPDGLVTPLRRMRHRRVVAHMTAAEEPDLAVLPALLSPGDHAVDLGANIGVYTRHMSEIVGPGGLVVSVEPIPLTFETLKSQRLRLDNVVWENCAVSAKPGSVRMATPSYPKGGPNYYQSRVIEGSAGQEGIDVPAKTVDSLVEDRGPISFIKCDVEGHELASLEGATDTLTRWRPAWLIEVSGNPDEPGSDAARCLEILAGHEYGCYWLSDGSLRARQPGDESVNYFFLAEHHVQLCREAGLLP
jgi:FkbM family methyltransferase